MFTLSVCNGNFLFLFFTNLICFNMVCKEAYTTVSISAKSVFDEITSTKTWAEDKIRCPVN